MKPWRRLTLFACMVLLPHSQAWAQFSDTMDVPIEGYPQTMQRFMDRGEKYAWVLSMAKWQFPRQQGRVIFVCWENPSPSLVAEMELVRKAANNWSQAGNFEFKGWKACAQPNDGIHIRVADTGPHTKGLGAQLNGKTDGMVLNFTFNNWSPACAQTQMREGCIYSIAVHEFGHALGIAHEQNRHDAPGECAMRRQGGDGDLHLTPYDPKSVMNYCNPIYNNNGELSRYDRQAIEAFYRQ